MRRMTIACLLMSSSIASASSPWHLIETIATERAVAVSPAAIAAARVSPALDAFDSTSPALELDLPEGKRVSAQRASSTRRSAQDFTWLGHVDGDPDQQVLLTRVGAHLGGYLSIASGIYELTSDSEGTLLLKLDSERFPFCGGALPAPSSLRSMTPAPAAITGGDEPIDVLQVFSPGAITQLGGQAQAFAFAQSAVDSANLAFSNSQMQARLRLVGVRLTTRADSGDSSTDLDWLVTNAEVAGWRNEVGADLVGMIAEFSNACGQGYLMGSPPHVSFAPLAFQVSARSCAVGNLSYAHEHGHNIGFHHNPEDSGGGSPSFPYAYGHYVNGQFRTVMSYANPCTSGCTRRPYFSNPSVQYTGLDTGVVGERDNGWAGDQTGPIAAAFRVSSRFANGFE
jgi:peptidyl-Asp metalloendopeptidase